MTGLTLVQQGVFTSDGSNKRIDLPGGADYILVANLTQAATTQTTGRGVRFEWWPNLPTAADEGFMWTKQDSSHALDLEPLASGGILYRTEVPAPEAAVAASAITAANPAVVTATAHGYSVGDRVVSVSNTAMKQIGGMVFEVTAVGGANAFTLGYLDASGFAAAETSCSFRRLPPDFEVLPGALFITKITQAASAVVTFSEAHNYKVGDVIYFRVPSEFGMVEMDGLQGKVTAVATSTITVDIDSTAFTAFAFPASASYGKFAIAGLAGKRGLYDDWFSSNRSLLDLDAFRSGLFVPYMHLAAGVDSPAGSNNDVIQWQAYRAG